MNSVIRKANESDIDFMLSLDKEYFEEYIVSVDGKFDESIWRKYLNSDLSRAAVQLNESQRIGYFRYSELHEESEKFAYLRVIAITKQMQNQGFGKTLYLHFESEIKKQGHSIIRLSCPLSSNAIAWYPKLGFKYFEKTENSIKYEKFMVLQKFPPDCNSPLQGGR